MSAKEQLDLKLLVSKHAEQAAQEHIEFTKGNFPKWAKGHEAELASVFKHYASIGAHEAFNSLWRNGKITP